jgi:release factor glutamine methyltransferase
MATAEGRTGQGQIWTTRRLLAWMTDHFRRVGIDSPRVVAEMLLAHVLGCDRLRLYMEVDRPATPLQRSSLRELVARASKHEPVQYLVGEAWFLGRAFEVNRGVFIPRPCTEMLVEHVLHWLRAAPGHANPLLADVGTGTGCIAVSLAAGLPGARVVATDDRAGALEVASRNAQRHGVADRVEPRRGAGVDPLGRGGERFDAIVSNPPYVSDAEWAAVAPGVRDHEPPEAIRAGSEGLDVIGPLIGEAPALLRPGGRLVLEIANAQRDAVLALTAANPLLGDAEVFRDHEGLWRMIVATRQ